jgi:hypothetical protein
VGGGFCHLFARMADNLGRGIQKQTSHDEGHQKVRPCRATPPDEPGSPKHRNIADGVIPAA